MAGREPRRRQRWFRNRSAPVGALWRDVVVADLMLPVVDVANGRKECSESSKRPKYWESPRPLIVQLRNDAIEVARQVLRMVKPDTHALTGVPFS